MAEASWIDQGGGHWQLSGELGYGTVAGVLETAGRALRGAGAIEVDLQGVTRADSAGLALLVEWTRASVRAGRSIRFIHVPPQLLSIAQVCGLEQILPLAG
jgi:phospholipid transport system transporter-binding protein